MKAVVISLGRQLSANPIVHTPLNAPAALCVREKCSSWEIIFCRPTYYCIKVGLDSEITQVNRFLLYVVVLEF